MDFTFAMGPSEGSDSRQGSARRYSTGQWEDLKPTIQTLYINQNRTTKEIVSTLKKAGFVVSCVCYHSQKRTQWRLTDYYLGKDS
jgi:hypothetical protein